jgi:hypothetical protein
MGGSLKLDKLLIQMLIENEYRGNIIAPVAIIGCRPHSNQLFVEHFLIPFHDKLMSSTYKWDVVDVVEAFDNIATEEVAGTAGTKDPAVYV